MSFLLKRMFSIVPFGPFCNKKKSVIFYAVWWHSNIFTCTLNCTSCIHLHNNLLVLKINTKRMKQDNFSSFFSKVYGDRLQLFRIRIRMWSVIMLRFLQPHQHCHFPIMNGKFSHFHICFFRSHQNLKDSRKKRFCFLNLRIIIIIAVIIEKLLKHLKCEAIIEV